MAASIHAGPAGAISDRATFAAARRLRVLSALLGVGLVLVVGGSVLAIGSVHRWAYVPLFWATGVLAVLALLRAAAIAQLRRRLGRSRFAFHSSGRWLVLDVEEPYGLRTWSFDLDRPMVPSVPLLLPGLLFVAWVLLQMVPLPPAVADALSGVQTLPGGGSETTGWRTLSVSAGQTTTGLAFLAWALVLHVVAASALGRRDAEQRFRRFVSVLGLALALLGLVQLASGTRLIYGLFKPRQGRGELIFGPFVNRNHFASYMLMVTPIAFGVFAHAYRRYRARVGPRANLRRQMVILSGADGLPVLYASIPALATVGALIATTSRGGLISFVGGLALAALGLMRRRAVPAWAFAAVFTLVALSWFGLERIQMRLERFSDDSPGRTIVWADTLDRLGGRWFGGSGFNTFDASATRTTAWALPEGATPWIEPYEASVADVPRAGYRTPQGIPGLAWYAEAHNDYLQVLAETGAVGLLLALWAAARALGAARSDPWLLAAVAGVLLHAFVEFGLHVPAIVALFVVVTAIRPHAARA